MLRKHKRLDSWFISRYGMNLYRGCTHNCVYCDGRAEGYYVDGEFGKDVTVKINAIEILSRELDPKRKRTPFKPGFIMVGGGVGDSYQPVEENYQLSRKALELIYKYNFPVHMLTKSTIIKRDIDILKKINEQSRAIVSCSLSSVDEDMSAVFEPGVPSPVERLKMLEYFRSRDIVCGMFLLPVIPFITDTEELIEEAVRKAASIPLDFVIFGGMTLKQGRQKDCFFNVLNKHFPKYVSEYQNIYKWNKWGEAAGTYYSFINQRFNSIAKKYKMPVRIPLKFYKDIVDENDTVTLILDHIDYLTKLAGKTSPYGYAAYSISQLKEPLSAMNGSLKDLKGVGATTEKIILEILETGSSSYYEKIFN